MSSDGTKAIVGYDDVGGRLYINNEPLPVEITSIAASVSNNKVLLNWQTATEVNNYGFEIERSVAQISNLFNNWEKIGFVNGHGNSNSPKDYSFVDANPPSGKVQYRLKQIDTDGSFEYSQVVQVETELPKQFSLEQNYPNPFNPTTTIKYSIPSVMVSLPDEVRLSNHNNADVIPSLSRDEVHVTLKIYDLLGREVATLVNENQKPGTYNYQFSIGSYELSSGIYFYQLQVGDFIQTKKMLIMK
ncbi:MAG: T9SS type A sorting domain-containing protein [Ignavibacteriales bacterium]|nr:T9SS type A sorting domain-containing protein [Ignavibacteriales bacterium]